jgi:hypothetical protein
MDMIVRAAVPEMRQADCPLCWARPAERCQDLFPPGDHLARWLAAAEAGFIPWPVLNTLVSCLRVISQRVLVPEETPLGSIA